VLATWLRLLPTILAIVSALRPKAFRHGAIAARLFQGIEVGALDVFDQGDFHHSNSSRSRTRAGIARSPAICAARQRRSPATI